MKSYCIGNCLQRISVLQFQCCSLKLVVLSWSTKLLVLRLYSFSKYRNSIVGQINWPTALNTTVHIYFLLHSCSDNLILTTFRNLFLVRINCCRCQESQNCCRNFQFTTSLTVLHTTFHVGHKYILHCEECAGPMVPLLLQHLVIKLENCYPVFAWSSGDNICCLPGGCGLCRTFALAIPFYFLLFISPAENIVL